MRPLFSVCKGCAALWFCTNQTLCRPDSQSMLWLFCFNYFFFCDDSYLLPAVKSRGYSCQVCQEVWSETKLWASQLLGSALLRRPLSAFWKEEKTTGGAVATVKLKRVSFVHLCM